MSYTKPLPEEDKWSGPFYAAALQGKLVMQRCAATGRFFFPPAPVSPYTRDTKWTWEELSGKGRIGSYVVMHQKYFAGFDEEMPYPVIDVDLEEGGARMMSNIVELGDRKLEVGMPVEVVFQKASEEFALPVFRPA